MRFSKFFLLALLAFPLAGFGQQTYSAPQKTKPLLGFAELGVTDRTDLILELTSKHCDIEEHRDGGKTYITARKCYSELPTVNNVFFYLEDNVLKSIHVNVYSSFDDYLKSLIKTYGKPRTTSKGPGILDRRYKWRKNGLDVELHIREEQNLDPRLPLSLMLQEELKGTVYYSLAKDNDAVKRQNAQKAKEQRKKIETLL